MARKPAAPADEEEQDLDSLLDEVDEDEEAFDLSDIEEAQIGAHASGRYLCKVVDAKLAKIKTGDNAGQPQFAIRFKPIHPASNKPIYKNAQLKGKGAPFTKGLLKNLGVDVNAPIRPSNIVADEEGNDRLIWLTLSVRKDRPTDNNIDATEPFDGEYPEGFEGDDNDEDGV